MMTQKNKKLLFGILSGLVVFLIASYYADNTVDSHVDNQTTDRETISQDKYQQYELEYDSKDINDNEFDALVTNAKVVRVIDGDTIDVVFDVEPDKTYRIRLLGIDTPETVDPRRPVECFGKESSDIAKKLLSDKRILLKSDPEADEIDRYGRLLRNVFLADGTDFNAFMVEYGYASAYVSFPQNKARKAELRALEKHAKENNHGLWNPVICP